MKALDRQIGGDHYKKYAIQPIEFISKNNLTYIQGNVLKYILRFNDKNGKEDIAKAIHYLEMGLYMDNPTIVDRMKAIEFCAINDLSQNQKLVVLALSAGLYDVTIHLINKEF